MDGQGGQGRQGSCYNPSKIVADPLIGNVQEALFIESLLVKAPPSKKEALNFGLLVG